MTPIHVSVSLCRSVLLMCLLKEARAQQRLTRERAAEAAKTDLVEEGESEEDDSDPRSAASAAASRYACANRHARLCTKACASLE